MFVCETQNTVLCWSRGTNLQSPTLEGPAKNSILCLAAQIARHMCSVIRCAPTRRTIHAHHSFYVGKCVKSFLKHDPLHKGASHPHAADWSRTAQPHDPTLALIGALGIFATKSLRQGCGPTRFNCTSKSHLSMRDCTPAVYVNSACGFQKGYY